MTSASDAPERIVIRAGTPGDVADIHAGLLGHCHGGRRSGQDHQYAGRSAPLTASGKSPAFSTLIAEVDGSLRRHVPVSSPSSRPGSGRPGVYVQDLFVEERFRGLRIGERLLRRVGGAVEGRGRRSTSGYRSMRATIAAPGFLPTARRRARTRRNRCTPPMARPSSPSPTSTTDTPGNEGSEPK